MRCWHSRAAIRGTGPKPSRLWAESCGGSPTSRRLWRSTGRPFECTEDLGDPKELANALYNVSLAMVFVQGNGTDASRDALDEAEALYRELGDVGGIGDVEWGRGNYTAYVDDDSAAAMAHMKKSIEYYEAGRERVRDGLGKLRGRTYEPSDR